jgi:hypothetical protein
MTLNAGPIVGAIVRELIVRLAVVKRMTREAGEFPALETGRFDQAVVLASAHPDHAIGPEVSRSTDPDLAANTRFNQGC